MKSATAPLFVLLIPLAVLAQDGKGTVENVEITSPALDGNLIGDSATRAISIYLPPSYHTSETRYPVFYWLDGFWGSGRLSGTALMDDMIRGGEIGEMIGVHLSGTNRFGGSY